MQVSRRGFFKGIGAVVGVVAAAKYLPPELTPPQKLPQTISLTPIIKTTKDGAPAGSIEYYCGNKVPPDGWILCDGQRLSKYRFPTLHSVIGDTYGSTPLTFNVPDLRGRIPDRFWSL